MAITTKIGDKGKTNVLFGHMVDKTHPIMEVCGTLDELNATLGVARASVVAPNMKQEILAIQQILFVLGAEVATLPQDFHKLKKSIVKEDIDKIEKAIEILEHYNDINNWFIPGEALSSAFLEKARTICRRLERRLLQYNYHNEDARVYLNRLSDYLWLLAQKEEYYLRGIERKKTETTKVTVQQTIL